MNEKYEHEPIESDVFDHSEAYAERLQERSDEAREAMEEIDESALDVVNKLAK